MQSKEDHTLEKRNELLHRTLATVVIETGLLVAIAIVALVGNSCVLYMFYKMPRFRTVTSNYIMTLAASDVLMAAFVMPTTIVTSSCGRDVLGEQMGPIIGGFGYILVFGSLQTTSLIAVNRFFCVVKRILYRKYFTPKFVKITIVLVWIIAILNTLIVNALGIGKMTFSPGRLIYFITLKNRTSNEVFSWVSLVLFSCLPMFLTAVCYWKVYQTVKIHKAKFSSRTEHAYAITLSNEEIDITKSVLGIVCGFVFCWVPCSIVVILSMYIDLPRHAEMVFTYTAYLSSAVNPLIFNAFNKPFRRRLIKELIPRLKTRRKNSVAAVEAAFSIPTRSRYPSRVVIDNVRRYGWGEDKISSHLPMQFLTS